MPLNILPAAHQSASPFMAAHVHFSWLLTKHHSDILPSSLLFVDFAFFLSTPGWSLRTLMGVDGFDIRLTFFKVKKWQCSLFSLRPPSLTLSVNLNSSALVPNLFYVWIQPALAASPQKLQVPSICTHLKWGELLCTTRQWKHWQGRIKWDRSHIIKLCFGQPCLKKGNGFLTEEKDLTMSKDNDFMNYTLKLITHSPLE